MPRVKDLKIERFSGLRSSKPLSPRRKRFDFTAGLLLTVQRGRMPLRRPSGWARRRPPLILS